MNPILRPVVGTALAVSLAFVGALAVRAGGLGVPVQVLVLVLGVVASGMAGRVAGLGAALLTVAGFNYWFTEPFYTFFVDDPENFLIFGLFLVLGGAMGTLSDRLRRLTREQVLQGFSHDLRTPLAIIGGTAAALRSSLEDRVDPAALDPLATIERETRDLDRQLDNLLGLARLSGRGRQDFSLVPAEELLVSCRDRCALWLPGRVLEVDLPDGLPLVRVETTLLEQALVNLVSNADRYAPVGTAIVLSLAATPKMVELRVSDRGPGVPPAEKTAIFLKFRRGTAGVGRRGTGLGLALVAATARLHGGGAGVRDREGGGSVFYIRLPRDKARP